VIVRPLRRLKGRARRYLPSVRGEAVVLLYHRIDSPPDDPWGNCVDPSRFAEQLDAIRSTFDPLSLEELVSGLASGEVPPRSVCVTFDDGYQDNLQVAKPLLERYAVPATVFVVSGYVDSGRDFWWDELEALTLRSRLPPSLRLDVGRDPFEWRGPAEPDAPAPEWRAWRRPTTKRQALFASLYGKLRALSHDERLAVLAELRVRADGGVRSPAPLTSRTDEIRALADSPFVTIGAHTASHPPLSSLPYEQQRDEIGSSKLALEDLLGCSVDGFSYPFSDLDNRTVELVRETAFRWACAGGNRPVRRDSPVHALPRVVAGNWRGDEIVDRLTKLVRA
jgi:peptidoglycan/xylan/chitin deacetylase (PgdA/CDA1 family)